MRGAKQQQDRGGNARKEQNVDIIIIKAETLEKKFKLLQHSKLLVSSVK